MRYSQQMQAARRLIVPLCRYAVAFATLFAACGLLWAQTGGTGAISGAVTDPTEAMVVGAQVKATEVSTGYTRIVQTDDRGMYVISLLPTGQYTLEVTKQGFKVTTSPDVQVTVAETKVLNVKLQTGTVTQTITVATSAVELETESSGMGRVTNSQMVANLPLVTRNFTQIIALNPGVAQSLNNAGALGRGEGSQQGEAAGGAIMSQGATSDRQQL